MTDYEHRASKISEGRLSKRLLVVAVGLILLYGVFGSSFGLEEHPEHLHE